MEHVESRLRFLGGQEACGRRPQADMSNHEPRTKACALCKLLSFRYLVKLATSAISAGLKTFCCAHRGAAFQLIPHGFTAVVGEIGETEAESFEWTLLDTEFAHGDSTDERRLLTRLCLRQDDRYSELSLAVPNKNPILVVKEKNGRP